MSDYGGQCLELAQYHGKQTPHYGLKLGCNTLSSPGLLLRSITTGITSFGRASRNAFGLCLRFFCNLEGFELFLRRVVAVIGFLELIFLVSRNGELELLQGRHRAAAAWKESFHIAR